MSQSNNLFIRIFSLGKFTFLSLLALVVLFLASVGAEYFEHRRIERNWRTISAEIDRQTTDGLQREFSAYQNETLDGIRTIAALSSIRSVLQVSPDTTRSTYFEILRQHEQPNLTLELFDRNKELLGWVENRGPIIDTAELTGTTTSFVLHGPIYSYLIVIVPIKENAMIIGYMDGKRLFDVNYPINNRFISNSVFTSTFTSRLDLTPSFDFSSDARVSSDPNVLSVPLSGLDAKVFGFAYVQRPTVTAVLEELRTNVHRFQALVLVLVAVVALGILLRGNGLIPSDSTRTVVVITEIWLLRYVLVWIDFPSSILPVGVFDPKFFASSFGFGLARSLGDLLLSSTALLVSVLLLIQLVIRYFSPIASSISLLRRLIAMATIAVSIFLLLLFLRGYTATIRSAVFDSSLSFNDPTSVLPSTELAVMWLSILLVSLSLVVGATILLLVCYRAMRNVLGANANPLETWICLIPLLVIGSGLFGTLQPNPLTAQVPRLLMICCLLVLPVWISTRQHVRIAAGRIWFGIGTIAVLLFLPSVDEQAHEADRTHVQLIANEIVRPEDSWLTFLINKALDELTGPEAIRVMVNNDTSEVEKLAFTAWAKSILSREGNNCAVSFVNLTGKVVSEFNIGLVSRPVHDGLVGIIPYIRSVHAEETNQNGATVKLYTGYAPIVDENGIELGGVWVEVSGGRQSFLRGETPQILRNFTDEEFESHFRTVVLSEFFQGKLVSTTDATMPLNRALPAGVENQGNGDEPVWLMEKINGKLYETYYIPDVNGNASHSWLALSMEALGLRWHLYAFLRYLLFFIVIAAIASLLVLLIRIFGGRSIRMSFRTKLLISFVVVSIIPMIILFFYNRQYARERSEGTTVKELRNQTEVVVHDLQRELGINAPVTLAELTNEQCADIAGDLNTDFNVYLGSGMQASSKLEMFTAELIDPSLSASAYNNIFLKRENFFSEHQAIGASPYIVGYRPLVAENGSIIGVVSVPTLYHQGEIDEELTRRNVFLFGSYSLAILISVVIGSLFANRIAAPIRRLKSATQRIAAGQLDVKLNSNRKDELGDLEDSFQRMTRELKETQDEIVRTQRELAWREMAKQVAHEIKNPLTPIKLSIQHLRQAYRDGVVDFGRTLDQVTATILGQIEALSRIASEFSRFGRMPERALAPCDVHEVLREAERLFQQQDGIRFIEEFATSDPIITADVEELRRAFINIIRNAIQAVNGNGTITLKTSVEDSMSEIDITDNGPGIPETVRARLFEPNFSTKTDGMGLGLPIVKQIITDLGGTINVDTHIGFGTTVVIRLPITGRK